MRNNASCRSEGVVRDQLRNAALAGPCAAPTSPGLDSGVYAQALSMLWVHFLGTLSTGRAGRAPCR